MYQRWNVKKVLLCIFFIMQLTLIILYWMSNEYTSKNLHNLNSAVIFIKKNSFNITTFKHKYFTFNSRVILKTKYVEALFENFNTSLCYKFGTDLKLMKRSRDLNWKCLCLPGWHGNDCGQPEVIWRALLASRKKPIIPLTRRTQRRLIHFSEINLINSEFAQIALYEVKNIVDLFIICDLSNSSQTIEKKLKNGYLNDLNDRILYLNGANRKEIWFKATNVIKNLRDDDIFFINNPFEVANFKALQFLKLYDKWPEPLTFRLRWSVYGFFWKHPLKTTLTAGACTLKYLYEALDNNVSIMKIISNDLNAKQGFIVGDLNHFGGWFCEFCSEPSLIIAALKMNLINNSIISENSLQKKIDVAYIEDLIENGIYLDGKTQLERAHRSNENYYAPYIVSNNSWNYDWLLLNLYSKMDYY